MRGKLWFITGLAAGFVLGTRAGREKYDEIVDNAKKVWEHPTVQEAAGVAQAQANRLYAEGKDKLGQTKIGEKMHATSNDSELTSTTDSLAGSAATTSSPRIPPSSSNGTSY
jgi:hypothetical protein